jgi:hypothetical protein
MRMPENGRSLQNGARFLGIASSLATVHARILRRLEWPSGVPIEGSLEKGKKQELAAIEPTYGNY